MGELIHVDFKAKKRIPRIATPKPTPSEQDKTAWIPQRCLICDAYLVFSPTRGWYCPYCKEKA